MRFLASLARKIIQFFAITWIASIVCALFGLLIVAIVEPSKDNIIIIAVIVPLLIAAMLGLLKLYRKSKNFWVVKGKDSANRLPKQNEQLTPKPNYVAVPLKTKFSADIMQAIKKIPPDVQSLLWFESVQANNPTHLNHCTEFYLGRQKIILPATPVKEPSFIDANLPISALPCACEPMGYFPSYEKMSPTQRAHYLDWLRDVSRPVDIGFVFVFYYGLERHLLFGDYEKAVSMIALLRQKHHNKSFHGYSSDAVLLCCLLHKRFDLLDEIGIHTLPPAHQIALMGAHGVSLSPALLMNAHKLFGFENSRYIKGNYDLFHEVLSESIRREHNNSGLPTRPEDFFDARGNFTLAIANYSLLPNQRFVSIPDVTTSSWLREDAYKLLSQTHEKVKAILREERKQST